MQHYHGVSEDTTALFDKANIKDMTNEVNIRGQNNHCEKGDWCKM